MEKEIKNSIDNAPKWRQEIWEKELIKIIEEEKYEDLSRTPDEFAIWLWQLMEQCSSVYAIPPAFFRYGSRKLETKRVFGTAGAIDKQIEKGIREKELDRELVPLIPIMEFKLVPTGNIEYFDPNLTSDQRKKRRYKRNKRKLERTANRKEMLKFKGLTRDRKLKAEYQVEIPEEERDYE